MYRNASLLSVGAAPRLLVPRVCALRSTDPLSRGNRRGPASPQAFPDARCRTHDASPLGNPRASRIRWGYRPWLGAPACVFLVEILRQGRLHRLRQHTHVRVMIETVDDLHAGDFEPGDLVARTGTSRIGPPTPFPRRWCFRGSDRLDADSLPGNIENRILQYLAGDRPAGLDGRLPVPKKGPVPSDPDREPQGTGLCYAGRLIRPRPVRGKPLQVRLEIAVVANLFVYLQPVPLAVGDDDTVGVRIEFHRRRKAEAVLRLKAFH